MEAKSVQMSLPTGCLRVDMDRDAGSRQLNWVGDDLLFEIDPRTFQETRIRRDLL